MLGYHGRSSGRVLPSRRPFSRNPLLAPIRKLNLAGDQQVDLTVHGGSEKAVYGYPAEHYEYWLKQLSDVSLSWGAFGENLTTEGLLEETLCIGDVLKVGSAVLQITQPRMPCYKLQLRFNRDDMIKRFRERRLGVASARRSGEESHGLLVQLSAGYEPVQRIL